MENIDQNQQQIINSNRSFDIQEKQHRFDTMKTFWHKYTSTPKLQKLDLKDNQLHKLLYLFMDVSKQRFFEKLFEIKKKQNNKRVLQISFNYQNNMKDLNNTYDQRAQVLKQVFSDLQHNPNIILTSLSLVIHQIIISNLQKKGQYFYWQGFNHTKKIVIIIQNISQIQIGNIKAEMIDQLISFKANVIKIFKPQLQIISMMFQCYQCKQNFLHILDEAVYSVPNKCPNKEAQCKSKIFVPKKQQFQVQAIQKIKVQQYQGQGKNQRQITCQLRQNLVGLPNLGQTVLLTGILKTQSPQIKKKNNAISSPYILVNSYISLSQKINFNFERVNALKSNKRIIFQLIKSFCPTIFGHQLVKYGLLLALIGGSKHALDKEAQDTFRQNSHILLMGDPGLGKSQLLKFATSLIPKSNLVNATTVSSAGMTITVNRQNNQQHGSIQAGALLLSNNGICAIDQFDKFPDMNCLLQVMQQQQISVAKTGVVCTLKCNVSIFAACNPSNGKYNRGKTFKDNTKLSNAILSRLDLIFLMLDNPDPQRDKKLSRHIMKIQSSSNSSKKRNHVQRQYQEKQSQFLQNYLSLQQKLIKQCQKQQTILKIQQIRQYINYVKINIHPTLSQQACQVIKAFYLNLRQNNPSKSFQITNRHLESLVRLSMAKARLQCRQNVTQEDAFQITNLMQQSLFDAFQQLGMNTNSLKSNTTYNNMNVNVNQFKKAKIGVDKNPWQLSKPKKKAFFIKKLKQLSQEKNSNVWSKQQLLNLSKELQLEIQDFNNFIQQLNFQGTLLNAGNKKYKLMAS